MKFLRLPEVVGRVGLSPMTIWRREEARTFPLRVRLGPNSVAWVEEEIEAWQTARAAERKKRAAPHPQVSDSKPHAPDSR
jgi:prophage regulatory protein